MPSSESGWSRHGDCRLPYRRREPFRLECPVTVPTTGSSCLPPIDGNPRTHLSTCVVSVISGTYRRRISDQYVHCQDVCCCCRSKRSKSRAAITESPGISGTTDPFLHRPTHGALSLFRIISTHQGFFHFLPFSLSLSVPSPTVFFHKRFVVISSPSFYLSVSFVSIGTKSTSFLYHHLEHILPLCKHHPSKHSSNRPG